MVTNSASDEFLPDGRLDEDIGFFTERELDRITGISRTTRWRLRRQGKFPQSVSLSARRVGTSKAKVKAWIRARESATTAER
jgi:predicted DNA-binding transcriptional regulator AlpA